MNSTQHTLIELIRHGIGQSDVCHISKGVDWQKTFSLSKTHGMAAIAFDGISGCFEKGIDLDIDIDLKLDWIGKARKTEQRYFKHEKHVQELASFFKKHGIRMMVLKGYGLSLNYPKPNHRPCGDIDIYLFGEQERADMLIQNELGIKIDKKHHHHTVFGFQGECVENHYDFLNVHVRKSNKRMEKLLKELCHTYTTEDIDNVYFPSVEFNTIYLLRHCAAHFASTEMTLRQVLDWGFFIQKYHTKINWDEYLPYIKKEGMHRFYNLLGLFCVNYLGFEESIFHELKPDVLLERFSNEIMAPEFKDHEDGSLKKSLSVKPRRWWHNRWKNRLCYPDSAWSEFAYGLWAKILKPSHFIQ